jgi:type II secretory pathway component PulF
VLSVVFSKFLAQFADSLSLFDRGNAPTTTLLAFIWVPPLLLALAAGVAVVAMSSPSWRARLRWRLPAFREASLAQLASAMAVMLKNGLTLPEALALAETVEANSPAGPALAQWRQLVQAGRGKPAQWPESFHPFPPMFMWLVNKGGEDLAAGFQKAAQIYHARASYRIELALYGALPISILLLGQMVLWQALPLFRALIVTLNALGSFGD